MQSVRQEQGVYQRYADLLLGRGKAYRCFCSRERLERVRAVRAKQGLQTGYDGLCGRMSEREAQERERRGEPFVVRMRVDVQEEDVEVVDQVRGVVRFHKDLIDEQVLLKADKFPTYHLASVVDDHLMGISHVIRGEEWLSSAPKHVLLYDYLEFPKELAPKMIHLPLLLDKQRRKLSKRHGDVSVQSFLDKDYEVSALLNFVLLLGWNSGQEGKELYFDLEEMIREFDISRVQKGNAIVDEDRLRWFNSQHLRHRMNTDKKSFLQRAKSQLVLIYPDLFDKFSDAYVEKALSIIHERANYYSELHSPALVGYFFKDPQWESLNELELEEFRSTLSENRALKILDGVYIIFKSLSEDEFADREVIADRLKKFWSENEISQRDVFYPLRLALTGSKKGGAIAETVILLGKENCLRRLENATNFFKSRASTSLNDGSS